MAGIPVCLIRKAASAVFLDPILWPQSHLRRGKRPVRDKQGPT